MQKVVHPDSFVVSTTRVHVRGRYLATTGCCHGRLSLLTRPAVDQPCTDSLLLTPESACYEPHPHAGFET